MGAIDEIIREASAEQKGSSRWALSDHLTHLTIGSLAVIAGVLAGVSNTAEWARILGAISGFAAAMFAGIQTLARAEERSRYHARQSGRFGGVVLDAKVLSERGNPPPSQKELHELVKRLTDIRCEVFGDSGPATDSAS